MDETVLINAHKSGVHIYIYIYIYMCAYTLLKIFKGTLRALPLITIQIYQYSDSKQELD